MYSLVYSVCDVCWGLPPHTSSSQSRLVLRAQDGALHAALTPTSASSRLHPTVFGFVSVCECVCVLPGEMHSHRGGNLVHYVLWFAAVASGLWRRVLCHLLPTGFLMRVCDLDASSLTTVSFPLFTSVFSILITLFIALAWRNLLGWGGVGWVAWVGGLRTLEFLANNKAAWGWAWVCGILKVQRLHHLTTLSRILGNCFWWASILGSSLLKSPSPHPLRLDIPPFPPNLSICANTSAAQVQASVQKLVLSLHVEFYDMASGAGTAVFNELPTLKTWRILTSCLTNGA